MKLLLLLIIVPIATILTAQNIPIHLTTEWNKAGYEGEIPCLNDLRNAVNEFGIDNSGVTDVSAAVQAALESIGDNEVLYFPNGSYLFKKTISVPSNRVVRGESPVHTKLLFELNANANMFDISGTTTTETTINTIGGFGDVQFTAADASAFLVGDDIEIEQDNDPALHYTNPIWEASWAQYIKGQILKITAINGNTITVDRTFTFEYNSNFTIKMRKIEAKSNVGFENFYVERVDDNTGLINNNFNFLYANNCWLRRIHSYNTARYHIRMDNSRNIEIRECEIEMADDCGGSGAGYGALAQKHTGDCLIEDNIFHDIRHPLIAKEGANRNVYAYNYCFDIRNNTACDSDPSQPYADISLHGHYPAYNLFESNIVGRISSTDYWGPAGPGNTFFRNRITTNKGIWLQEYSHEQVLLGNELVGSAKMEANRDGTILGTILVANSIQGVVDYPSIYPVEKSLYLSSKPEFFKNSPWPSIGDGNTPGAGTIPAKTRWENGKAISTEQLCSACNYPNLGELQNICGLTSVTLSSQLSATNRTFNWYKDNNLIAGENSDKMTVASPGVYRVVADSAGCITEDAITITDKISVTLPDDFTLCNPSVVNLNAQNTSIPNISYTWSTGETTQTKTVFEAGYYTVTVSASGCGSATDQIHVSSSLLDITGDKLTAPGKASLHINTAGTFNWYDTMVDGDILHTGSHYSPEVTDSSWFFVEDAIGVPFATGRIATDQKNGYYNNEFSGVWYVFDAKAPLTLNSIKVYAQNAQEVTISIISAQGAIVGTVTQSITKGEQTVVCDFKIPIGANYKLSSEGTTGKLWREKEGGMWPYVQSKYIVFHTTEPEWIATKANYAFWYDIRFTAGNSCARTPILATVNSLLPYIDCHGDKDGTAFMDDCAICVGGNTSKIACVSQKITLIRGWNLISTYIESEDMSISSRFPNASTVKTANSFFSASQAPYLNQLQYIQAGAGYLIYNSENEVITIQGKRMNPISSVIKPGWNIVGVDSAESIPLTNYPDADIIKDFNGFYKHGNPVNSLTELQPGKAYFIKK